MRRHLVAALSGHLEALRRNGIAAPPGLRDLVNALHGVSGCQGGPRMASDGDPLDGGVMQQLALTYRDSADRLGVSESTVKRLVRDGRLPAVDILGSRRIRARDLNAFVESLATANRGAA